MKRERFQEMDAFGDNEPERPWPTRLVVLAIYGGGAACWTIVIGLLWLLLSAA